MKVLVIDYRETFEMKNIISKSIKRLRKSVILKMKSWRRDKEFILSTTNRTQSRIRWLERDLIRTLERQIELEQELEKTKINWNEALIKMKQLIDLFFERMLKISIFIYSSTLFLFISMCREVH